MFVIVDIRKIILNFIMVLMFYFYDYIYFSYDLYLMFVFFFKVVNMKLVIIKFFMFIIVNLEIDVYLNCIVIGILQLDICWEYKGVIVGYGVLIIENIQKFGNYICIVENFVGSF